MISRLFWRQWMKFCKAMVDYEAPIPEQIDDGYELTLINNRRKWAQLWFRASMHYMKSLNNSN